MTTHSTTGAGGVGGSASVGGNGFAVGGRGGRGGTVGKGGSGGSAHVAGNGSAIGGDGGDAGIFWRPVMGGASPYERLLEMHELHGPIERDEFGLVVPGRGGAGGCVDARVEAGGRILPLLPLLYILRLWSPYAIDQVDRTVPSDPQDFWNRARALFPEKAARAEAHIAHCLDVTIPAGVAAPDPYKQWPS